MSYILSMVIRIQINVEDIFSYTEKLHGNISDNHGLVQALYNMPNQRFERIHYILSLIKSNEDSPLLVSGNRAAPWPKTNIHCMFYKRKVEGIFFIWYKYKKTVQTGKQDSTHNPGF